MATSNVIPLISSVIPDQFPDFVRTGYFDSFTGSEYSKIVDFMRAYYEWLETTNQAINRSNRLVHDRDLDATLDEFLSYLKSEFAINIPNQSLGDKRLVYRHIKDFYRSKGSPASFKFLFRLLFNKDIEVEYPEYLSASESSWTSQESMRVKPLYANVSSAEIGLLKYRKIYGESSGQSAVVSDYMNMYSHGNVVSDLLLETGTISGAFIENEVVYAHNSSGEILQTANGHGLFCQILPAVSGIVPNSHSSLFFESGVNFLPGDPVTISAGGGYDAEAHVGKTSEGAVEQMLISSRGRGYTPGDRISTVDTYFKMSQYGGNFLYGEYIDGSVSSARATVANWDAANAKLWVHDISGNFDNWKDSPYVDQVEIITGRSSGTEGRIEEIFRSGGMGAQGYVREVDSAGNIISIGIENGGANYSFIPHFTILNPSNAAAYGAEFAGFGSDVGNILRVTIDSDGWGSTNGFGWGYNTSPKIHFRPTPVEFDKEVTYFLDDAPEDEIQTSNGGVQTEMTADDTFLNITIRMMDRSLISMSGNATTSAICTHDGRWTDETGHISSLGQEIYDGYYNQDYSYVIKVNKAIDDWRAVIKKLVHPVGTQCFGEYPYSDTSAYGVNVAFINGSTANSNTSTSTAITFANAMVDSYQSNIKAVWKMDDYSGDITEWIRGYDLKKYSVFNQVQYGLPGIDGTAIRGNMYTYFKVPKETSSGVFLNGDFTYSTWFKDTLVADIFRSYVAQFHNGQGEDKNQSLKIEIDVDNNLIVKEKHYNGINTTESEVANSYPVTYNDGRWHHLVITRNSSDVANVYVNAEMIASEIDISALPDFANNQTEIYFGGSNVGSAVDFGYHTIVDESVYWSEAMNAASVAALYNNRSGLFANKI